MEVALVMTVKNEARLLKQNIYYHLGIGIKKIFVYFDGTSDNGRELIEGIDGVVCLKSIYDDRYNHIDYLKKFTSNNKEHHTARQCLNSYDASLKCKEEKIDWLISIDVDEFFITSHNFDMSLVDFFREIDEEGFEMLQLGVYEVVPRKINYKNVALEENLFKPKKNFISKLDQIYFKPYDPYTQKEYIVSYWSSHTIGKCAIKIDADLVPHTVHRFKHIESGKVKSISKGKILHYFQYDFKDFLKKHENFKDHPATYLSGRKIGNVKQLFIKLANDSEKTEENILSFYKKNLLFDETRLERLKKTRLFNILPRKEAATIEINKPREILQKKKHLL